MKTILFVCVHNAGRSQMAEAFVTHLARERGQDVRGESAGTEVGERVNPLAVAVMGELGISLEDHRPKPLDDAMIARADRIITMGCGVDAEMCPATAHFSDDWGLEDPAGQDVESVRSIRDQIRVRVESLLDELESHDGQS